MSPRTPLLLGLPAIAVALQLACKPPVTPNQPPTLHVVAPADGADVPLTGGVVLVLDVVDPDGDAPLLLRVEEDGETLAEEDLLGDTLGLRLPLDLDVGEHELVIVARDAVSDGDTRTTRTFRVDGPPSAPGITLDPAQPTPGAEVVGTVTTPSRDPEGLDVVYGWAWLRGRAEVLTGTGEIATLPADSTGFGERWTLHFTAVEARGPQPIADGQTATTEVSFTLSNAPPTAPTEVRVSSTRPSPLHAVTCEVQGVTDPEGAAITPVFTWSRWTSGAWVVDPAQVDDVLPASATTAGERWRCEGAGSDGAQTGPAVEAELEVLAHHLSPLVADVRIPRSDGTAAALGRLVVADGSFLRAFDDLAGTSGDLLLGAATSAWDDPQRGAYAGPLWPTADRDGDGLPDLLAGRLDGASSWVPSMPWPSAGPLGSLDDATLDVGTSVPRHAVALDLDGDGLPGLALALDASPDVVTLWVDERVALSHGGVAEPDVTIVAPSLQEDLGVRLSAVDDLTGDGRPDLCVGRDLGIVPHASQRIGVFCFDTAALAAGPSTVSASEAWLTLGHAPTLSAGASVGMLDDVDGDGAADPWMGIPGFASERGRIGLFPSTAGDADFADFDQLLALEGTAAFDRYGAWARDVADLDGDGLRELAVAAPGAGRVYLWSGARLAAAVVSPRPADDVLDADEADWIVAADRLIDGDADLDGDGRVDLVFVVGDTLGVWLTNR